MLTALVSNKGTAPLDASFMLNLPMGGWTDCSRAGKSGTATTAFANYTECMHACLAAPPAACASWQFDEAPGVCTHNTDVPLTAHAVGSFCGVRGAWAPARADPHVAGGLTWTQRPRAVGPSMGDITLQPQGPVPNTPDPLLAWNPLVVVVVVVIAVCRSITDSRAPDLRQAQLDKAPSPAAPHAHRANNKRTTLTRRLWARRAVVPSCRRAVALPC